MANKGKLVWFAWTPWWRGVKVRKDLGGQYSPTKRIRTLAPNIINSRTTPSPTFFLKPSLSWQGCGAVLLLNNQWPFTVLDGGKMVHNVPI